MGGERDTVFIVNLNDRGPLNVVEMIQEGWGSWGEAKSFNIMLVINEANSSLTSRSQDVSVEV